MSLRTLLACSSSLLALAAALPVAGCAAENSDDSGASAQAQTAVQIEEFRVMFEPGNHWGGMGAGDVGESALGSNASTYFLTGAGSEYGDSPEIIHAIADADASLRFTYAQDGIWDGNYYETETGPGPVVHQLVSFVDVQLQYRIQGGAIQTLDLAASLDGRTGVVHVPADAAGKTLEYWFRITGGDGQTYWESRNAKNYHVEIKAAGSTSLNDVPHTSR